MECGESRWVFIDWDNCGPGSRLWDLAYAAHGFLPLAAETPVRAAALGLDALADGYGLDQQGRLDLAELLVPRITSMYDVLLRGHQQQVQPWCGLWEQGHGDIWASHADFTRTHLGTFRAALHSRPGTAYRGGIGR